MSLVELSLLPLAIVDVVFNFCLVTQVESDRAANLLQVERRVMRSIRLRDSPSWNSSTRWAGTRLPVR